MLTIKSVEIDWMLGYGNTPKVILNTNEHVTFQAPIYKSIDCGQGTLYLCEQGMFVKFLFEDPKNHKGFGGSIFEITLEDGTVKQLKGPWSSAASSVNGVLGTTLMEASYKADGERLLYPCNIDVKYLLPLLPDEVILEKQGTQYIPTLKGYSWRESKQIIQDREGQGKN